MINPKFYIIAILLLPLILKGQYKFHRSVYIGHQQGLPSDDVRSIAKDEDGFMWFATGSGLCRYDGQHIEVFQPEEHMLLPEFKLNIHDMLLEGDTLWIGHDAGLLLFNRITERFLEFPFENPDSNKTIHKVNSILKINNEELWLGVWKEGIARFQISTGEIKIYAYIDNGAIDQALIATTKDVDEIIQDVKSDAILWAASNAGLLRLNRESGAMRWYYKGFADKTKEAHFNQYYKIHQEPDGKIYLGTYFDGVNVFDPSTESFSELPVIGDQQEDIFINSHIRHITSLEEHHLWITTNKGLLQYNIRTQRFTKAFKNGKNNFGGTNRYGITYIDKSDRIWHGYSTGVYLYDPLLQQFDYFRFRDMPEKTGAIPRQIIEDEQTGDLLLIGQYTEGIMDFNRSSGQWSRIPAPKRLLNEASYFHAWNMVKNSDGSLLILEEDHGLMTYRPKQPVLQWLPMQPDITLDGCKALIEDDKGFFWIGTHLSGLVRLDPDSQQFSYYKKELERPELNAFAKAIWHLFIDSINNMWIRRDMGYSVYLPARDTFLNLLHPPDYKNPIHIENFAEDRNGRVWMAGAPFLYYADVNHPEKGVLGKIRIFPDAEDTFYISYVEADQSGNIWAITSYGLVCLNSDDLSTQEIGYDYGLHSHSRYLKTLRTGEMVAGHRDAISIFHPDSLKINTELPQPYVRRFKVFDKDLERDSNLLSKKQIVLSYKQNFFSIEYSAIAYTYAKQVKYKYKLDGFEEYWNDPGERRYAAYTNVPPGNYTFLIKVTNNEGLENVKPFQLQIRIIPPWWQTNWAITLFAVAFIGLIYFFYQLHLNQQLKQAENRRLKELDAVKTRLYTNITHEFRTPLTIIKGMMLQIQENPKRWLEEGGRMITRNTESLLQLVNQMLALRKLESGVMDVKYVQDDVIPYLKYLFESFRSLAESKGVEFQIHSEIDKLCMDYDPEKLQMIVSNLLSNAIKFTPEGGEVKIRFNTLGVLKTPRVLNLILTDTGVGIPPEKLPFIFDRFYQVDDSATRQGEGIGVGLALTKELVQLLDGEIQVASQPGQGTTFSILFPIRQTAEKVDSSEVIPVVRQPSSQLPVPKPSIISPGLTDQPSILIIEDNPDMVAYIKSCLEKRYELSVASNGKEGINKAFEIVPDLIISDVMMPEKDGFEVCKEVKRDERTSHVPIILLTAKADMDSKIQGLERGADAYLVKPFQPEELEVRIKKLLELRDHLKEKYSVDQKFLLEKIAPTDPEARFLNRAKAVILSNLDNDGFGVNELAESLALSRMQLHRKLKALVGQPASDYLRTFRLHQARHWLQHTDWSISEIAYRTGFRDQSYFTKVYKDFFDTIPSKDR